ncbi:MAG: outer membrane protein assembly factor BamA, partial [Polyangiaceae bacterium]|nr:outer membrane protein assembly factor BamA [Polyangiaceae bacterium]
MESTDAARTEDALRPAPAQREPDDAEAARGQPIAQVEIGGFRRMLREDMDGYLRAMRRGLPFTPEGLAGDVSELWASGFFDDVQAEISPRDDGVHVRIFVRERPSVDAIEFSGNHEIDEEDLREAASAELKVGSVLSYPAVSRAVQKIRDKYAEEGFVLAEISEEVKVKKGDKVVVKISIKENQKLKVRRITFVGNAHVKEPELREVMISGTPGLFEFGTGGPFRRDVLERDLLAINAMYYDRGYLSVQVDTPRVQLTPDRDGVEITIPIQEGPRYRIRRLKVREVDRDGVEVEPLGGRRHLRDMVRAAPGQYFNRAELVKDIAGIQTMYRDAGYANVDVPPDTQLDPAKEEVDIDIAIRRGAPVHFGRIEIRGNTKTQDKVIRREMEIEEGALFSETKLERSRARILALGYFERADISTEQGAGPGLIDVAVEIGEKPTGTFQVGAGFSSAESFMFTAKIQQQNLFGTGRSLSLQAEISALRQLVDFSYYDPYFMDTR